MPGMNLGLDLGAIKNAWDSMRGNTIQDYVKSPEFQEKVLTGYKQQMGGEDPTALIEAQNGLVAHGWGPKTSAGYIQGLLGHLQNAHQQAQFNSVQAENAPQTTYAPPEKTPPVNPGGPLAQGMEPSPDLSLSFGGVTGRTPAKNLTQDQITRIAGPQAFSDLTKASSFLEAPDKQAYYQAETGSKKADASYRKTLENIAQQNADRETANGPLNDFATAQALGIKPAQYERLTGKPWPLKNSPDQPISDFISSEDQGNNGTAPNQPIPNPQIGITRNPKGGTTIRVNPEKIPMSAANDVYQRTLKDTGDPIKAQKAYQDFIKANSVATGQGGEQGRLDVRTGAPYLQNQQDVATRKALGTSAGSPLPPSTQKDITGLEGAIRQIDNIEKNYDETFLGPIKGTDAAFEFRRKLGGYVNSPLGEQETVFREALKDVGDQLLRARSGAQINETEYKRLRSMLPQATDEPQVFDAGLKRFKNEMGSMIARKTELGTTPRSQIQTGGVQRGGQNARGNTQQPGNVAPEGTIIVNPSTGDKLKKQNGQWVPFNG